MKKKMVAITSAALAGLVAGGSGPASVSAQNVAGYTENVQVQVPAFAFLDCQDD